MLANECPECGVRPGQFHRARCEVEICPYCGDHLVRCPCDGPFTPLDDRIPWSGVFPGVEECEEFGWFAQLVPGRGWVACERDDPGAEPDLYRLHEEAIWDRWNKRYILARHLSLKRGGRAEGGIP